jgi:hypothetical protein
MIQRNDANSLPIYSAQALRLTGNRALAMLDEREAQQDVEVTPSGYRAALRILNKRQQLVPYVPNRAQLHFRQHRTGRDLLLKPRQIGFSTEIQADMFVTAMTETVMGITLAHDAITTARLRRMAARFYDNLPDILKPARGLDSATITTYPRTQSEITIATAGNANAGIGGTYNRVHGSEVSRWVNAEDLMTGMLQGIPHGHGSVVLESTANGAQGWFYAECMAALRGESDWTLHFYPWWWEEGYCIALEPGETLDFTEDEQALVRKHRLTSEQIKWRRRKQKEIPLTFIQEYPEDPVTCFLTSGRGVFTLHPKTLYTCEDTAPIEKHEYVAALDWGQSDDYTVLCIMDATDNREVVLMRWRQERWDAIRRSAIQLLKQWRVTKLIPEKNSSSSNIEALADELYDAGVDITVQPFNMSNKAKSDLVGTMMTALDDGLRLLDDDVATHELRAYAASQTTTGLYTYNAPHGTHDDTVIARMLAVYGMIYRYG